MTDKSIDTIRATRNLFIQLINSLSPEEVNKIPEGFNNNIIWNFGHIIVSQQILCYKLAGIPLKIDESYLLKYSKGTKPESYIDETEQAFLKEQSIQLVNELISDIEKKVFDNYTIYITSFGVELTNIDDAVKFLTMHDGLHFGYAMALKRALKK